FAFPALVGGSGPTYWGGIGATDYPRFFGTTVVAFALAALASRRPLPGRGFLVACAIGAVLLALGPRTGWLDTIIRTVAPVMGRFRVASMALVLALPVAVLLSAAGVARAIDAQPSRRAAWPWIAAIAALGLALLTVGRGGYVAVAQALRP